MATKSAPSIPTALAPQTSRIQMASFGALVMALLTAVAMLAYAVILLIAGTPRGGA
jgi:hypothetical protein